MLVAEASCTHASPEDSPDLPPALDKFRQAARHANVVDLFDCQGQLDKNTRRIMSILPDARLRQCARMDDSHGQPIGDMHRSLKEARLQSGTRYAILTTELAPRPDKNGLLPKILAAGLVLNIMFPSWFSVGGPPLALEVLSIVLLVPGVAIWMWSADLRRRLG